VTVRKRIDDAVYEAAGALRDRDSTRRKFILLVSNGINAKNNTHSYDETLKLLLASNISVYSIGVEAPIGVPLVSRRFSTLSSYARETGGDIYYSTNEADLSRLYAQVGEQARHQYTIGYYSYGTDTRKDYHSVEVRVRRGDLTVMCRDGYYPVAR
jgi:VWFA-related protein